jgi:hypothetical protein
LWNPECQPGVRSTFDWARKEEVAEHKVAFLDAWKGLEAARKYMCQFDTKNNIIVMCNEVENELHRLRAQEKKKQKPRIEWLKK